MFRLMIVIPLVAFLSACGSNRVIIRPVPEKTAPLNERTRAFKDLSPESGVQTTFFRNGVPVGTLLNSIMLTDGTRIEDPRDLLPAVEEASPAANYIRSFETKSTTATIASTVGYAGIGVGLAVMLAPLLLTRSFSSDTSPLFIGVGVGGGISLLSLIPLFIGFINGGQAQADRVSAFQTYPRSLQRRLALEDEDAPAQQKPTPSEVDRRTDVPLRVSLF